jgi:hypothetical protein
MGEARLARYGAWRWSQDAGRSEFSMKKISSFMTELLPCGARWEHKGHLAHRYYALHRLPVYRMNVNPLSTGIGPLLLRA